MKRFKYNTPKLSPDSVCRSCTQRNCKLPREILKFMLKAGILEAEIKVVHCADYELKTEE